MNAWWQMWPKQLSAETCDEIIDLGIAIERQEAVVGHKGPAGSQASPKIRRSWVRWIKRRHPWAEIWDRVMEYFHEANNNAFGFNIGTMREMQFTEYSATDAQHYDWHEDLTWRNNTPSHRKLSCVIQLSDPDSYVGGDLEVEKEPPNPTTLRQRGTVIVFPCFLKHRVVPVTKGVRFSLVTWCEGPKFR